MTPELEIMQIATLASAADGYRYCGPAEGCAITCYLWNGRRWPRAWRHAGHHSGHPAIIGFARTRRQAQAQRRRHLSAIAAGQTPPAVLVLQKMP